MKEKEYKVLKKRPIKGKDGKRYGSQSLCSDGEVRTYLNPHGKGAKYAEELRTGERMTNAGVRKTTARGGTLHLTGKGKAYRAGYLQAQHDSAATYNLKRSGGRSSGGKK